MKNKATKNLQTIPGVGESLSQDFLDIGIKRVSCLKGKDPEKLYQKICTKQGGRVDRCVLYVCREAVYFAETPESKRNPKKLKWWEWKD